MTRNKYYLYSGNHECFVYIKYKSTLPRDNACYDIELILSYIMSQTDHFDVLHGMVNQRLKK